MPGSRSDAYRYLERRFGIQKQDLKPLSLRERSGDLWLVRGETDLNVETDGIRALRVSNRGFKPTTYFLQLAGDHVGKNTVTLSDEELEMLLNREMIERTGMDKGYVALRYDGQILGCGYFMNEKVSTRISKSRSQHLKNILDM